MQYKNPNKMLGRNPSRGTLHPSPDLGAAGLARKDETIPVSPWINKYYSAVDLKGAGAPMSGKAIEKRRKRTERGGKGSQENVSMKNDFHVHDRLPPFSPVVVQIPTSPRLCVAAGGWRRSARSPVVEWSDAVALAGCRRGQGRCNKH